MKRRALLDLLQVFATVLLLWLAWHMAGGSGLLARLQAAEVGWLAAALALTVPMQVLSAWRWRYTARRLDVRLGFRRAVEDYYLASLLNAILPSGVAGDAVRVWRQGRSQVPTGTERYRLALHAVVLERASGQMALALVAVVAVLAAPPALAGLGLAPLMLVALGLLLVLCLGVLASLVLGLGAGSPLAGLRVLVHDFRRAFSPWSAMATQLVLSLAIVATYLASFYLVAGSLGVWLAPGVALVAIPLVLYVMVIPLSVGGLGLRELMAAALWPLMGLSAGDGALTALLYWAVMLAGSLPGAFVLASRRLANPGESQPVGSGSVGQVMAARRFAVEQEPGLRADPRRAS